MLLYETLIYIFPTYFIEHTHTQMGGIVYEIPWWQFVILFKDPGIRYSPSLFFYSFVDYMY